MIFNEKMVGGRERVTTDEGRVLTAKKLKRDQVAKIAWFTGCKNFVGNHLWLFGREHPQC